MALLTVSQLLDNVPNRTNRIGGKYYYVPFDIIHYFSSNVGLQILLFSLQERSVSMEDDVTWWETINIMTEYPLLTHHD